MAAACSSTGPHAPPAPEGASTDSGQTSAASADAAASSPDAATSRHAPALHVLFIGNSYTSTGDLPGLVQKLAAGPDQAQAIGVDSITPGGVTFSDHWMSTGAVARIDTGGFSHVVLQDQSVDPVGDPASFQTYGMQLAAEAQQHGAQVVLYETWARQTGDALYAEAWSGGDPKTLQQRLRDAYASLAKLTGASVAPVGDAWETSLATQPSIQLFQADGSHPTEAGTYLAACVFYATLTGRSPVGITTRPASVTAVTAAALAKIAAKAVLGTGG